MCGREMYGREMCGREMSGREVSGQEVSPTTVNHGPIKKRENSKFEEDYIKHVDLHETCGSTFTVYSFVEHGNTLCQIVQ